MMSYAKKRVEPCIMKVTCIPDDGVLVPNARPLHAGESDDVPVVQSTTCGKNQQWQQ